ncbi:MAG: leucyl aminopeptidase [Candidatus Heimdallarchaeota archaeon]|nr:leucyl aminopeptidase [Candidatus Heimdallarchaeota archaeon]
MNIKTSSEAIETLDVDAIVIGLYKDNTHGETAIRLGAIAPYLELDEFTGKTKQTMILYNVEGVKARRIYLVGLGEKEKCNFESVRNAASIAARTLRDRGLKSIAFEALHGDAQSTAEGAILGLYKYDFLKTQNLDKIKKVDEIIFSGNDVDAWNTGVIMAEGQNYARFLAETPANICTPTWFAEKAKEYLDGIDNIEIIVHDEEWAKEKKMGSFLSVAAGTEEPAKFLEIQYNGGNENDPPIVYVGKGITFDTGGISLKPSANMGAMRGDMGGAASVVGTLYAISKLGLKKNVIGLTPLTENMPSGRATKPSDVVTASNGKTIQVDNTDAEGRLILADALVYAEKEFNPHTVIDIATLTGSIGVALGEAFIGVFTRSDELWNELNRAGEKTFDRFWRMPLDPIYRKALDTPLADVNNVGSRAGGACQAAEFLGEFIEMKRWCHVDIAGVMDSPGSSDYHPKKGMTGKPVRGLVEFCKQME